MTPPTTMSFVGEMKEECEQIWYMLQPNTNVSRGSAKFSDQDVVKHPHIKGVLL